MNKELYARFKKMRTEHPLSSATYAWYWLKDEILHEVQERLDPVLSLITESNGEMYFKGITITRHTDVDHDPFDGVGDHENAQLHIRPSRDHYHVEGRAWFKFEYTRAQRTHDARKTMSRGVAAEHVAEQIKAELQWVRDVYRGNIASVDFLIKRGDEIIEWIGPFEDGQEDECDRELARVLRRLR